jgi:cob(I)alamin adenosyltransferase
VKIYTRRGDDGSTSLLGPGRVPKSSPRVEAYGTVDELNAALGVVLAHDDQGWITSDLEVVQTRLFHLGAELATTDQTTAAALERISDQDVARLEGWIDRLEAELPPLANFILPGGPPLAASLQMARAVCRRAERRVVAIHLQGDAGALAVRYLNRLADLLFVLARWCCARAGAPERQWKGGRS